MFDFKTRTIYDNNSMGVRKAILTNFLYFMRSDSLST